MKKFLPETTPTIMTSFALFPVSIKCTIQHDKIQSSSVTVSSVIGDKICKSQAPWMASRKFFNHLRNVYIWRCLYEHEAVSMS